MDIVDQLAPHFEQQNIIAISLLTLEKQVTITIGKVTTRNNPCSVTNQFGMGK